jgi:hypothetical protein
VTDAACHLVVSASRFTSYTTELARVCNVSKAPHVAQRLSRYNRFCSVFSPYSLNSFDGSLGIYRRGRITCLLNSKPKRFSWCYSLFQCSANISRVLHVKGPGASTLLMMVHFPGYSVKGGPWSMLEMSKISMRHFCHGG